MNRTPLLLEPASHAISPARARARTASVLRHPKDAWILAAAILQGAITAAAVSLAILGGRTGMMIAAATLGVSIWWGSNTVAHIHLHRPLFHARSANVAFSLFLSAALGVPQSLWRARHLAHHAGAARPRIARGAIFFTEIALIAGVWIGIGLLAPGSLIFAYAPGFALGMGLCSLQGALEHRAERGDPGSGVSHYGRLYNLLWFNDGYHVEHHRSPGEHWTCLPARRTAADVAFASAYPPVIRWIELAFSSKPQSRLSNRTAARALGVLERIVLRSAALQRFVISRHERALAALLPAIGQRPLRRIGIVGGGLFPRTVVAIRRLLPDADLVVMDASAHNIDLARRYLAARGLGERKVTFEQTRFVPGSRLDFDLLVTPLALVGDRKALYAATSPVPTLIHDWIWRARGDRSAIVSALLLKRINLVDRRDLA